MKLQILIEPKDGRLATAARIEDVLRRLPEYTTEAANTGDKYVTHFEDFAVTIETDEATRAVLRLDKEHAKEVVRRGWPCGRCPDAGDCDFFVRGSQAAAAKCSLVTEYERAEQEALETLAFCDTTCNAYASGTCPFRNKRDCSKYFQNV